MKDIDWETLDGVEEVVKLFKGSVIMIRGNSRKILPQIPDSRFNTILTDPPYDQTEYMPSLPDRVKKEFAQEFRRLLKYDGNLILFCGYLDKWKWYYILRAASMIFKREIIWVYGNPSNIPAPNNIQASHETALWFAKTDRHYFKQKVLHRSWINVPVPSGILKPEWIPDKKIYVTPKPIGLLKPLLGFSTPEGGWVLDPFMGTGSTNVASLKMHMHSVGIEKRRRIFDVAVSRVQELENRQKGQVKLTDIIANNGD